MQRWSTHYVRLASILTGIWSMSQTATCGTEKMETGVKITLHIYNYAHVKSETLIRAKQEATRIYREIGVETVWLDHLVDEEKKDPAPFRMWEIYINIVPHVTQEVGPLTDSIGIAPGAGRNRARLYVWYDRVDSLYRRQI